MKEKIHLKNGICKMAGELYVHENFDKNKRYHPALKFFNLGCGV